ncbi:MAG: hypothetical protein HOV76_23975 [Hamadaea sp.]|nr:hypothetical protein [Hamadaea sp.]
MRIRRALSGVLAGLLALFLAGSPAAAVPLLPTDIAAKVPGSGHAAVGKVATIVVELHNYGSNPTSGGQVTTEIVAPGGTVIDPSWERGMVDSPACTWLVAHRHVKCVMSGMVYPDNDNPSGVYSFSKSYDRFQVTQKCTTPGRITYHYGNDTKTSNNSATLRVTVDGVSAATCTTKPSASPKSSASAKPRPTLSPSAAPSAAPSASASLAATEPTATASDSMAAIIESPSVDVTPVITLAGDSGGSGPWVAVAVVAAVGLVVAGVGILWRIRRRGAVPADL